MKNIKDFNQFLNEGHVYNDFGNEYLIITREGNGISLKLTPEGKEKLKGVYDEKRSLDESDFADLFETIQANSELVFHVNLGDSGFGLTEAPGITDGYHWDGINWESESEDSEVYYYNDYMIDNFLEALLDDESVFFNKA